MDPLEGADRVPQSAFTAGREAGRKAIVVVANTIASECEG